MKIYRPGLVAVGLVLFNFHASAATLYVSLQSTNPLPPYSSWDTAATNIQDAVGAALLGDTVLVTNGVYDFGGAVVYGQETNRVALTNAVLLLSVNGPDVTTIIGTNQTRCVYVGSNSVVSGFTLTGGRGSGTGDTLKEMSGGGAWCETGGTVTNCAINNNFAQTIASGGFEGGGGGGVYGGLAVNCTVTGNTGFLGGGARSCTLLNCTLAGNTATAGGGTYQCTLFNCLVTGNSSMPGGAYAGSGGGTQSSVNYNCRLIGNTAQDYAGGTSQGQNYNCVIAGNTSFHGGGGYGGNYWNCTICGNKGDGGGGVVGYSGTTLTNCIIYFNNLSGGAPNNGAGGAYDHCCTFPLPDGPGNITNDPGFIDWPDGFYQLKCGSPCIDTGTDLGSLYTNDIRGMIRPLDGNGDGTAGFDIGAYEYNPASDYVPFIQANYTNCVTQFPVTFTGGIGGCAAYYWWDFGDGITVSNQIQLTYAWNSPGQYDVKLAVYYPDLGQTLTATTRVQVVQQQIHYVNGANSTPVFPYTNWSTAATNIQDAVGAAQAGETVLVTNGVYSSGSTIVSGSIGNRVALTNGALLLSVNGPQTTMIRGGSQIRGVYVGSNSVMSGFTITNGVADNGAGIWCQPGVRVVNCLVVSNFANLDIYSAGYGGGIYGGTISNCTLRGNLAVRGGGAYRAVLYNCTLTNNSSTIYGGPPGSGGGVYQCLAYNCPIVGNKADGYGGGAYQGTNFNCSIIGNQASYGGGTYQSTDINCYLGRNTASSGGGIYQSTDFNCIISGNTATYEAGAADGASLYNCTVVGNVTTNVAGTMLGAVSGGSAYNSIIYYNNPPDGPNWVNNPWLDHCCTMPFSSYGSGTITNEPLFVDAAAGDFRLKCGSPCIDTGTSGASYPTNDIRGVLRPFDGNGDGVARYDMGAYEYYPPIDQIPVIHALVPFTNFASGYTVSFAAQIAGCADYFWWDFGDGVTVTNQSKVSHTWTSAGAFDVRLLAYYSSLGQALSATTSLQVVERPVYYADINSPNPTFPYTNWTTAAHVIQDAITADTTPGRLVLVAEGVYLSGSVIVFGLEYNRVALTNVVVVQSVNGPGTTVIQGTTLTRCAYLGNYAILNGFTLANGRGSGSGDVYKEQSGGGVWSEPGGVISNCWITGSQGRFGGGAYQGTFNNCTFSGNTADTGGGACQGTFYNCMFTNNNAYVNGGGACQGTFHNCTFTNNTASNDGGGVYSNTLYNCVFSGNRAYDNGGGASSSTLYNCVFSGNRAYNYGGGASSSTLYNCMISSNFAWKGGGSYSNTLWNCVLMGNTADSQGGGSYRDVLYNCTLSGNTATYYGGGVFYGTFYNCTIVGNTAESGGGVLGNYAYNSIIYNNTATDYPNWRDLSGHNCCTTPLLPFSNSGNITNDPMFLNLAGGNFHLHFGSPCIDAGSDLSAFITNDLDGKSRPLDGDGDGVAKFDMGAYEFDLLATVGTNWLVGYGLDPNDSMVFASHPNGSALSVLQSWIADLNPTNPDSLFQILAITNGPPVAVLFANSSNRVYTLLSNTNLAAGWLSVPGQANVPGNGGVMTLQDTNTLPYNFYRVSVSVP